MAFGSGARFCGTRRRLPCWFARRSWRWLRSAAGLRSRRCVAGFCSGFSAVSAVFSAVATAPGFFRPAPAAVPRRRFFCSVVASAGAAAVVCSACRALARARRRRLLRGPAAVASSSCETRGTNASPRVGARKDTAADAAGRALRGYVKTVGIACREGISRVGRARSRGYAAAGRSAHGAHGRRAAAARRRAQAHGSSSA